MNLAEITQEEVEILKVFRNLLDDVSYGWAYAIGESPKEYVVCMYKENGLWSQYVIRNGQRYDCNYHGDLYNLCLENLKGFGSNDVGNYLTRNFELELANIKRRRK